MPSAVPHSAAAAAAADIVPSPPPTTSASASPSRADSRDRVDRVLPLMHLHGNVVAALAENRRQRRRRRVRVDAAQRAGIAVQDKDELHDETPRITRRAPAKFRGRLRNRQARRHFREGGRDETRGRAAASSASARRAEDRARSERRMRRRGLDAIAALPGIPEEARRIRVEADDRQPVGRESPEARPGRRRAARGTIVAAWKRSSAVATSMSSG